MNNILLAATHFFPGFGGIESSLYYMAKTIKNKSHNPIILAEKSSPDLPLLDGIEGIKIIRYAPRHWRGIMTIIQPFVDTLVINRALKRIIQEENIDAVWARHPYFVCSAVKCGFKGKIIYIPPMAKRVFSKNEIRTNDNNSLRDIAVKIVTDIKSIMIEKFEINALKKATKIIVFSNMVKRIFVDKYTIDEGSFKIIPPGVDIDKFKPKDKDFDLLRVLGIDERSRILLSVGRVTKGKNVGLLLRAFSMIKNRDVFLIVIGTSAQMPYFVNLAKELGIENRVKFAGFKKDVSPFYNLADFLVVPSTLEGFGHVYLEAMACGVPCIAFKTDYPKICVATEEIIVEGKNGFLVDKPDAENLSAKINHAISITKEKYQEMSDFSRENCLEKYNWGSFVAKTLSI